MVAYVIATETIRDEATFTRNREVPKTITAFGGNACATTYEGSHTRMLLCLCNTWID